MNRDAPAAVRMLSAVNAARDADDARRAHDDAREDTGEAGSVDLRALDGGRATALAVRAQPGSRRSGVLGTWNGALKLGIGAPPEDGRANEGLVRMLAELFGLSRSAVTLVAGARSRNKTFRLEAGPDLVRLRLDELLQE